MCLFLKAHNAFPAAQQINNKSHITCKQELLYNQHNDYHKKGHNNIGNKQILLFFIYTFINLY